jgi:SET domain-containing protein
VVARIGFKDLKRESGFNDYPMYWDKKSDCIAFGPINLLNHSSSPTARLVRDRRECRIDMFAKTDLKKGEELTINYDCKLWFDVIE